MKAITAAHKEQLEKITNDLEEKGDAVKTASLNYNEQVHAYNDLVEQASSLRDEIVNDQETYFDERSERWQEGDKGEAHQEWSEEWTGADLEVVDEIEEFEVEHPQTLRDLPHKPNDFQ